MALRRNETTGTKPHLIHGGLFPLVSFLRKPPLAAGLLRRPGQSNANRLVAMVRHRMCFQAK
jgi:hypothetical protein